MMHARIPASVRPGRGNQRTRASIEQLLCWAFQREFASLDFDELASTSGTAPPGVGMEYIMIERARLGCRVDGGGRSEPHPDADAVASALAALPQGHGGRRVALWIAELARSGLTPDWHQDERPRCVPVAWRSCKHGDFAKTDVAGSVEVMGRKGLRRVDLTVCPVTYVNTGREIAAARRDYLAWWGALLELRDTFRVYGGLTAFEVTEQMPPAAPWRMSDA
ncbi:hypothetical protein P775_09780 [Puniceibacterium antarcticum]|uniref:Uncharacterized protein n=1 Tax=Puniceibacterium antarcticum TaxID=1206336 RepID=A0A2G8RFV8_9RHOB|nr:hypothetical protein [Puniceibacterium antarcticum]PIL20419.1 hypothetical protein P775_09780 [Puniceibacterium antarcticum]